MPPKGFRGPRPTINKETFPRLIKMLFKNYKWRLIAVAFCVIEKHAICLLVLQHIYLPCYKMTSEPSCG